jgi:hypothetical protein
MAEMSIVDAFEHPSVIDSANWTILHPCLPAEGITIFHTVAQAHQSARPTNPEAIVDVMRFGSSPHTTTQIDQQESRVV